MDERESRVRPMLVKGDCQRLFSGMGRLSENSVVSIKNKSHAVTAGIVVPEGGAQGVIIAQGGSIGGWSLYLKDGKLRYCYNLFGVQRYVDSEPPLAPGVQQVRMEFAYAGPGLGKGGTVGLFVEGKRIGEGSVAATAAMIFSADDTCDVGKEGGALVADDYPTPNHFTGEVNWVEIDVGDAAEDSDHRLAPDELLRIAMARQSEELNHPSRSGFVGGNASITTSTARRMPNNAAETNAVLVNHRTSCSDRPVPRAIEPTTGLTICLDLAWRFAMSSSLSARHRHSRFRRCQGTRSSCRRAHESSREGEGVTGSGCHDVSRKRSAGNREPRDARRASP